MNIIIITHPSFLGGKKFNAFSSMPKYANLLLTGLQQLGHSVQMVAPRSQLFGLPVPSKLKGLLGYVDQYLIFPQQLKRIAKKSSADTLFVFTDHALGPWVPVVKHRPHIIHCHDFLAQRSALGEVPENPLSRFGKKYQQFIRKGYLQGKNFISISRKTQKDLQHFVPPQHIDLSEVVYNAISNFWEPVPIAVAAPFLKKEFGEHITSGYLLHVGGNQWYKNKVELINVYNAWRRTTGTPLPLLLIGEMPDALLQEAIQTSPFAIDIHLKVNATDELVRAAYSLATVFVFPSVAEGFGWPIAEAMACGCPVIIINDDPMTEVAGGCAYLLPLYPAKELAAIDAWRLQSAAILETAVSASPTERLTKKECGVRNAERFSKEKIIHQIESIYKRVLQNEL